MSRNNNQSKSAARAGTSKSSQERSGILSDTDSNPSRNHFQDFCHSAVYTDQGKFPKDKVKMPRLLNSLSPDEVGGCIEGRGQSKGPLHSWKKLNKEDQLFNFVIVGSTGTIEVLAACDVSDLHERIQIDKCLRLACFELEASRAQFNTTGHSYEVHLTNVSSLRITPTSNLMFHSGPTAHSYI